jgi:hypothetical protein
MLACCLYNEIAVSILRGAELRDAVSQAGETVKESGQRPGGRFAARLM